MRYFLFQAKADDRDYFQTLRSLEAKLSGGQSAKVVASFIGLNLLISFGSQNINN